MWLLPGQLHAVLVRSPHPHARIVRIEAGPARGASGVRAVLTATQVRGRDRVPFLQQDWPLLAGEYVRHAGEPVAIVAAETLKAAERAADLVEVEYEPLDALLDTDEALKAGEIIFQQRIRRGEATVALGRSDVVTVEAVFRTPQQDHANVEPLAVLAVPEGVGGVLLYVNTENPFHVQQAVASALGVSHNAVRVVAARSGGGLGGRLETSSAAAAHAALVAVATARPVRLVLARPTDLAAGAKRHPSRIAVRLGATSDGHLIGAEVDLVLDGGAYATVSPHVLFRAAVASCGPYRVPNVRVDARVVRSHRVPSGWVRGAGEAQAAFAIEGAMDMLAERLGLDPLVLRYRNMLRIGDETITGQSLEEGVGLAQALDRVSEAANWAQGSVKSASGNVLSGRGLAVSMSGIGLGAVARQAGGVGAHVTVAADGSVSVAAGTPDTGGGSSSALDQIVADELNCSRDLVRSVPTGAHHLPDSGPSVAGRGTVLAGLAVREACRVIRASMEPVVADRGYSWLEAVEACNRQGVGLAGFGWAPAPETPFDAAAGQGRAFPGYTFSACVAEVEVDLETAETRVRRLRVAHDAGVILCPGTAAAQAEGGAVLGAGFALLEDTREVLGRITLSGAGSYLVPGSCDAPQVSVDFVGAALESGSPRRQESLRGNRTEHRSCHRRGHSQRHWNEALRTAGNPRTASLGHEGRRYAPWLSRSRSFSS